MKIYLDLDFCCHLENDGTMTLVETDVFNGKCSEYVEGFRYVPEGETWTRFDGVEFRGLMIAPAENYSALKKAQLQYERDEQIRWNGISVYVETDFVASQNYAVEDHLAINGILYEVINSIPCGVKIIPRQNVIETTEEEYIEKRREDA